jgi:hypothetical protein
MFKSEELIGSTEYLRGTLPVAQLVEALRYKVVGSIPDGVIGIFH